MQLNYFQQQALRSVAITDKTIAALAHRTLGLSGEAGVLANEIKKIIRDKDGQLSQEDVLFVKEKIGDVLYYAAVLAEYADLSLDEVVASNLQKSVEFKNKRQQK